MRVSRYFISLGLVLGVLYLIVFLPGTANTPKLGIDLVGGIRVIFTAQPPAGEEVTGTSMEQARQIIEDRINGSGVTASTVQIQGDDQLVVSIPGGTDTDVARLGQAAQLNFRPVIAPAVPVSCDPSKNPPAATPSGSASATAGASSAPSGAARSTPATSTSPTSKAANASGANSSGTATGAAGNARNERPLAAPTTTAAAPSTGTTAPATPRTTAPASGASTPAASTPAGSGTAATPAPSSSAAQAAPACYSDVVTQLTKADPTLKIPTTEAGYAALTQQQQQSIAAGLANFKCSSASTQPDRASSYYIACDTTNGQSVAYLLGSVIVRGTQVDEANAVAPSTGQGGSSEWTVSLTLNDSGQKAWGDWTTKHNTGSQQGTGATQCGAAGGGQPCSDYVAFTLDGAVVSAPATNEPIVGQATQISGSFTPQSAKTLADQLKFGALPLTFRTDSNERVSASLGTSQLQAAFLAGGIGLALVVVYSLLYYRGLGLVTIASLIVSGLLTYAMMVILGQQIGFTLDLAGIAGLIVALGITADSFVVFFERIKDEVHEGRSVRVAVPRGWIRARRTVISADVVSFLAAVILYIFASADVKGFAFTLGLSTVLDLFVVVVFTHPIVSLLSRSRAFGSPRFTGLNSVRAGGITPDRDEPRAKRAAGRKSETTSRGADAAERAASRRGRTVRETAVLDEPEVDDREATELDDDSDLNFTEADDTTETAAEAEDATAEDDEVAPEPEEPRRRTTPSGGTAAERAAARRARQRQQRDEKGE